jgi:epoxyqueuosine reductase QueG
MNAQQVKASLASCITGAIAQFSAEHEAATEWGAPIVGFADAHGPYVQALPQIISPTHHLPQDLLADATVVIVYFLPFVPGIERANRAGDEPSPSWITAYNETNSMFPAIDAQVTALIRSWGYAAVCPGDIGTVDPQHIYSNWSQRHFAYAAGIGTFGLNNMLITEVGTCGRIRTIVTNLPVTPDQPLKEERCLYKRNGSCKLCAQHCPIGAIHTDAPFDRQACWSRLDVFERNLGADACGKCVVGLPCSLHDPSRSAN